MIENSSSTYQLFQLAQEPLSQDILRSVQPLLADSESRNFDSLQQVQTLLGYLSESIYLKDESLLTDYIVWLRKRYASIEVPLNFLKQMLLSTSNLIQKQSPQEIAQQVDSYISSSINILEKSLESRDSLPHATEKLYTVREHYIDLLLSGKRREAKELIEELLSKGTTIKYIYLYIFQESQYMIGQLWMENKISVAQEHYCTAATQFIMSQLYSHVFSSNRIGRNIVLSCVGGELHEIGIRMIADFFEMEGWDTYYLGANTPVSDIIQIVSEQQPDIIGLSMTMSYHRKILLHIISSIKANQKIRNIPILVGGYAFTQDKELVSKVKADGFAKDANEAILIANTLSKRTNN